jgi:hypothetical protein
MLVLYRCLIYVTLIGTDLFAVRFSLLFRKLYLLEFSSCVFVESIFTPYLCFFKAGRLALSLILLYL